MRKILLLLSSLLAFTGNVISQQDPLYSMYMFDKMLINPAFSGSSNYAVASIKNREQMMSLPGHPKTQTLNFHTPIQKYHIGVGGKILNDQIGPQKTMHIALNVSYHLSLAGGKLSVGIEGGNIRRRVSVEDLTVNNKQDLSLINASNTTKQGDASIGMYYQKKQFYIGLSNYHVLAGKTTVNEIQQASTVLFLAGNVFNLNPDFTLEASTLFRYQPKTLRQTDLNLVLMFNNRFGAGFGYRTNTAATIYIRIGILENLRLAYAYDLSISRTALSTGNSQEILLSYGIKLAPPPAKKEIHPRYYF